MRQFTVLLAVIVTIKDSFHCTAHGQENEHVHITKDEVSVILGEIARLRQQNDMLVKTVEEQTQRLNKIQETHDSEVKRLEDMILKQLQCFKDINDCTLRNDTMATETRPKRLTENSEDTVAFYALFTKEINDGHKGDIFVFDHAVTNIGQSYNPSTGIFTCMVPGVYLFSWTVFSDAGGYCMTELAHNGESMSTVYFGQGTYASTGTSTAVLQLQRGDNVNVKIVTARHIPNAPFTSLSGVRIA